MQGWDHIPNTKELSGRGPQSDVGTGKMMHGSFGEHGIILQLRFAKGRAVTRNEHELGYGKPKKKQLRDLLSHMLQSPRERLKRLLTFAAPHLFEGRLVPKSIFSRLDYESESGRDRL